MVYALFLGQVGLPSQREFIRDILLENLADHIPKKYSCEFTVGGHRSDAMGTVFIDGRKGVPKLYVEDVEKPLL